MNLKRNRPQVQIAVAPAYAIAIGRCEVGDRVVVEPDPDDPNDMLALVAKARGETIGYISPESWLVDAVHLGDKVVRAKISGIQHDENGRSGVLLKASVASHGRWAKYWHANY